MAISTAAKKYACGQHLKHIFEFWSDVPESGIPHDYSPSIKYSGQFERRVEDTVYSIRNVSTLNRHASTYVVIAAQ